MPGKPVGTDTTDWNALREAIKKRQRQSQAGQPVDTSTSQPTPKQEAE